MASQRSFSERTLTSVERIALSKSPFRTAIVGDEKLSTIVAPNWNEMGKLAALRFLEWVLANPNGVIALPTGKTPEPFIRWVVHYLSTWRTPETQKDFAACGFETHNGTLFPDMKSLHLVQIGELWPMSSSRPTSFITQLREMYIKPFGLDESKALLMDLDHVGVPAGYTIESLWRSNTSGGDSASPAGEDVSADLTLRYRSPRNALESLQQAAIKAVDDWCGQFEKRIRALGGIGFFLGGIGADGHIAFRSPPTDLHSTTGLLPTTYAMQASAAADLGGIEAARRRHVVTLGLDTLAFNRRAVVVILAAGEQKARAVADAVTCPSPSVTVPASVLGGLPHSRFYVTPSAALGLRARHLHLLECQGEVPCSNADVERAFVDLAVRVGTPILELTQEQIEADDFCRAVLRRRLGEDLTTLQRRVHDALVDKIESGLSLAFTQTTESPVILHTEPHPDDIILSYLPFVSREQELHPEHTDHHFAVLTSGFHSVSNSYLLERLQNDVLPFLRGPCFDALWTAGAIACKCTVNAECPHRQDEIWTFLDGIARNDAPQRAEATARRLLHVAAQCLDLTLTPDAPAAARSALEEAIERHFVAPLRAAYAGQADSVPVQKMKTCIREFEHENLWGYFGWNRACVHHLRLPFYLAGTPSAQQAPTPPTAQAGVPAVVAPLRALMERVCPSLVTSAFDPTDGLPDTRANSMVAVASALHAYCEELGTSPKPRVLGYRNIWSRFHPSESNVFVPVSLTQLSVMSGAFHGTFGSQCNASFPSPTFDGLQHRALYLAHRNQQGLRYPAPACVCPFDALSQQICVDQYAMLKTCLGDRFFSEHPSPEIRASRGFVFLRELSADDFISFVSSSAH